METVDNPDLQSYFVRTRCEGGHQAHPASRGGARPGRQAQCRGDGGARRRPGCGRQRHAGRALRRAGAPAARTGRPGTGDWRTRRGPSPRGGPALATTGPSWRRSTLRRPARGGSASPASWRTRRGHSSALIAAAPEQWWTVFFPIWTTTSQFSHDRPSRRRPRRPAHPHARLGRRVERRRDPRRGRAAPASTSSRSPTTNASMRPCRAGDGQARGSSSRSSWARRSRTPRRPCCGAVHRAAHPAVEALR